MYTHKGEGEVDLEVDGEDKLSECITIQWCTFNFLNKKNVVINKMFQWIKKIFSRNPTYREFINYLRDDSITVKERINYFYEYTHLFREQLQRDENKKDLYFLADLVVK
jgi:hypothetical protein